MQKDPREEILEYEKKAEEIEKKAKLEIENMKKEATQECQKMIQKAEKEIEAEFDEKLQAEKNSQKNWYAKKMDELDKKLSQIRQSSKNKVNLAAKKIAEEFFNLVKN